MPRDCSRKFKENKDIDEYVYDIFETPQISDNASQKTRGEFQDLEFQEVENPSLINTNIINTNKQDKLDISKTLFKSVFFVENFF